ncbi:MAG TPA: inositol-3-phosphate synthase, partial [Lacipirellulaceae bacterium]|nr:inositol-3-phosphate synthase [Lacipirellulaceae bacterium]
MTGPSSTARIGLWLIGARGGVAVTTLAGLIAQRRGLCDATGLVTALPPLAQLPLARWDQFVVGGHDIRTEPLADSLQRLHRDSGVLSPELVAACRGELADI